MAFEVETEMVSEGRRVWVHEMAMLGMITMDRLYGAGSAYPKDFHNKEHVKRGMQVIRRIGSFMGMTANEISVMVVAEGWHDMVLNKGPRANEEASALLCQEEMKRRGWGEMEIYVAGEMIRATIYEIDKNGVIWQNVGDINEEIGEYRLGLMKRIIADTDLSANGDEWSEYLPWAIAIGREVGILDSKKPDWVKFWTWQYTFLDGLYNKRGGFCTEGARALYPHMEYNCVASGRLRFPYGDFV